VDPPSQSVEITKSAKFTIKLSGVEKEKLSYQWRHNEKIINEQTFKSLTLSSVTEYDQGRYDCVVSNEYGNEVVSTSAELLVDCEFYNADIFVLYTSFFFIYHKSGIFIARNLSLMVAYALMKIKTDECLCWEILLLISYICGSDH